jgi:hypothetical protein
MGDECWPEDEDDYAVGICPRCECYLYVDDIWCDEIECPVCGWVGCAPMEVD